MTVTKVVIKSNNISYGPVPAFNDEVEQRVFIHRNGRVKITRYVFGYGVKKHGYVKASEENILLPSEKAKYMLHMISRYFNSCYEEPFVTDIGDFRISIHYKNGNVLKQRGSLCCECIIGKENLNSMIRRELNRNDLFLFGGAGHVGDKYICLSVRFSEYGKLYDYLTEDDSIMVGDMVRVPAGKDNLEKIVKVVDKEKLWEEELPMPPSEMKSVIGKVKMAGK